MPFELIPDAATAGLPAIVLGGQSYYVAPLLLRRIIAITALLPKVVALLRKLPDAGAAKRDMAPFEEADFDAAVDVVRHGLLRLYPGLTREDLLDAPITIDELVVAIPVILGQGGAQRGHDAAGE